MQRQIGARLDQGRFGMSSEIVAAWVSAITSVVALLFLILDYLEKRKARNQAGDSAMSEGALNGRLNSNRRLAILAILVVLSWAAAGFTYWHNRHGASLAGGVVYTLVGAVNLDGKMVTTIDVFAGIGNLGDSPTAALAYKVSVKKDGNVYQGTVMAVPKTATSYPLFPDKVGNIGVTFHDDDALYTKTATAIQPGNIVYGVLMVTFPTVSDYSVFTGGFELIINFSDVHSNTYTIDANIAHLTTDQKVPLMAMPGTHIEFAPVPAPPAAPAKPAPRPH